MAQVTMDGKEYVELISRVNTMEAENQLLIQALIMGTLKVDSDSAYRKVTYEVKADLTETEDMQLYMQLRIKDVAEKLGQNPLAVQLLFDEQEVFFNPYAGQFSTYGWDGNVAIKDMSKTLGDMYQHLEDGERLVDTEVEEEE